MKNITARWILGILIASALLVSLFCMGLMVYMQMFPMDLSIYDQYVYPNRTLITILAMPIILAILFGLPLWGAIKVIQDTTKVDKEK